MEHAPGRKRGVLIPLTKSGSLLDDAGYVVPRRLDFHIARTVRKYTQNDAPPDSNPYNGLHYSPETQPDGRLELAKRMTTGTVPLMSIDDSLWHGPITIGGQTFRVVFDTGSSDLFVPGPDCKVPDCVGHAIYDPNKSKTKTGLEKNFIMSYGGLGSIVRGKLYKDVVELDGLSAADQVFGVAVSMTGFNKAYFAADGVLGMAFPRLSYTTRRPVFQNLMIQKQVIDPIFSFRMAVGANCYSELALGFSNEKLFQPPMTYTNVIDSLYWTVKMEALTVNGNEVAGPVQASIDTGTTLIFGDADSVGKLYKVIDGAKPAPARFGPGRYTFPCDGPFPIVSLTFGGQPFGIGRYFSLGRLAEGSNECMGTIMTSPSLYIKRWIVGAAFLNNVYATFDATPKAPRVGFAKLAVSQTKNTNGGNSAAKSSGVSCTIM